VQSPLRWLVLLLLFTAALRAQSLEHARRAQLVLGDDVWSQVIRIENETRGGRYSRIVYALVFELQGLLWFYTDADGTQSFSLHHDNLAAEKNDFGPLLRDIERGFTRWTVVSPTQLMGITPSLSLRNGCFIESVALWRERIRRGEVVEAPRLLSYYFDPNLRRVGHTVFAFRDGDKVKLIDPLRPAAVVSLPAKLAADPLTLAREHGGNVVRKARFLSLESGKSSPATPPTAAPAIG
jgi:hypothetical protein